MELPFMHKKQQPQIIPGKGFVPIDRVREMAARGFSEPEMIDILRREGFSADEVDKALTQALRVGVTGEHDQPRQQEGWQPVYQRPQQEQQQFQWPSEAQAPPEPQQQEQQPTMGGLPTLQSLGAEAQQQMPQIPETSLPEGYYSQQYSSEEYIDYIVQQRMGEVAEKVKEIGRRYDDLQKRLDEIISSLKNVATKEASPQQTQIASKIDTFGETVSDIDNRLSGLEKAFKDTLPSLIDSVRALSDVVQKVRKEQH
jgi:uncharacterized phage infection (PIP) family protein YhgE